MLIREVITFLQHVAPPSLQESYDNAGLITGDETAACTGILCTLDSTEAVIDEAVAAGCNLVVAHHPIIFKGLRSLTGTHYVERVVIRAIRAGVAIYAIHTNLDNVYPGVSGTMAARLGLTDARILVPKTDTLSKIVVFVPASHAEAVRMAMFASGAGRIGDYDQCSFETEGSGGFRPLAGARPYSGQVGERHSSPEIRVEAVLPTHLQQAVLAAAKAAHPYEEVAFDLLPLANPHPGIGAGVLGMLPEALDARAFLDLLKRVFRVPVIRHTALPARQVSRVAVCGGAGSFLIANALNSGVDAYVTADLKYHEFFEADNRMLLADIGHFESEQYTSDLLQEVLAEKFHTFAVLKSEVITNPVNYY